MPKTLTDTDCASTAIDSLPHGLLVARIGILSAPCMPTDDDVATLGTTTPTTVNDKAGAQRKK